MVNKEQLNNFKYDINGLRAYAVAIVVLFHFGIAGFSAGFIGVDIFFVISGFLMTSIVHKGMQKQNFSFLKFYLSRAIRILPALVLLCLVLLVIGWFSLLPHDYQVLAKHVFSSVHFFSNITYLTESGYFDTTSHNKALLHTWSLSVEWQFYLLFPLIVALIYKISQSLKFIFIVFALGTLLSLALAIYSGVQHPSAGFYLLPTRAWELLAGGLVFYANLKIQNIKYSRLIEVLGFAFIVLSLYLFNSSTLWPSYHAILPVLGTMLVIWAQQQDSVFTKPVAFQVLGNISYSVYLWHWPIVFFLNYYELLNRIDLVCIGIFASLILGYISYRWVENPTRNKLSQYQTVTAYGIWIFTIGAVSALCIWIYLQNGVQNRVSPEVNKTLLFSQDMNSRREECLVMMGDPLKSCQYGQGPTSLLVVGDSHANAMMLGVENALPENTSVLSWNISGCTAVEGLKKSSHAKYECGKHITQILNLIQQQPKGLPILIVNRTNALFHGEPENENVSKPTRYIDQTFPAYNLDYKKQMQKAYVETLCKFAANNPVYVTRPTPEADFEVPPALAKRQAFTGINSDVSMSREKYQSRSEHAWEAQDIAQKKCGVQIIDISEAFCNDQVCSFVKNGQPLYMDDDHMSWKASTILTPYFKKIFETP